MSNFRRSCVFVFVNASVFVNESERMLSGCVYASERKRVNLMNNDVNLK